MSRRILKSRSSSLTEITKDVSFVTSSGNLYDYVASTDKLFIGALLPFSHLYFRLLVPNDTASTVSVRFWDGAKFSNVVDIVDETEGLNSSGLLRWSAPRDESWVYELDSFDVTGLESTEIYEKYWAEITFSADFNPLTSINYIGQKYSSDEDLYTYYPDLSHAHLKEQYLSGKTSWDDQAIMAADNIDMYLRGKKLIHSKDQIINPDVLKLASIHKTASIIYQAFGDGYVDNKKRAEAEFDETVRSGVPTLDNNQDGRLSRSEQGSNVRYMSR